MLILGTFFLPRALYKELLYPDFALAALLRNSFTSFRHHCASICRCPVLNVQMAQDDHTKTALIRQCTSESVCLNHRASCNIVWFIGRLMLFLNSFISSLKASM